MIDIKTQILIENDCYKAGKIIVRPTGIMVHSTGADNPYLNRYLPGDELIGYNKYGNHWNMSDADAEAKFGQKLSRCVNGIIGLDLNGNVQVYQTLPWNMRSWHCGASANNTHISFEICEDGLEDETYFNAVYSAAVELCAYLCREYKIDSSWIICHSEGAQLSIASNHADVMHWFPRFGKTMDMFRKDVKVALTEPKKEVEEDMTQDKFDEMMENWRSRNDPNYADIDSVPKDLRDETKTLLDAGCINGGTDAATNPNDVNLTRAALKSVIIAKRYVDMKIGGK